MPIFSNIINLVETSNIFFLKKDTEIKNNILFIRTIDVTDTYKIANLLKNEYKNYLVKHSFSSSNLLSSIVGIKKGENLVYIVIECLS